MSTDRLAEALRELRARGFTDAGRHGGVRYFRGTLTSSRGPLPVRIGIGDWDFLTYPQIDVEGGLDKFPKLRPHLDRFGGLCYFSRGSVILDRYDPTVAIAQSLEQAQSVLEKVLTDRGYVEADIENEFLAHWEYEEPAPWIAYMGSVKKGAASAPLCFWADRLGAFIADDLQSAQALCEAIGWKAADSSANRCWMFTTDKHPPAPRQFARNVAELFAWIRDWDEHLYKSIQHLLTTNEGHDFRMLPICVNTPIGRLGFVLDLEKVRGATAGKRKQNLHEHAAVTPIWRVVFRDLSPEFVHSRNLTFKDLSGRRITLIGCGAIGSQMAAALVRLGAGSGSGGLLRLIDPDRLQAENLGRHLLGYNRVFQHKAPALRDELLRQFPLARIEAVPGNAQDYASLLDGDLLVEATGEEALSEYTNARWLQAGRPAPVLYVWIKGNGECVQSLWTDTNEYGCFRCLRLNDPQEHRKERFPVLKQAPRRKVLGCRAFTPYAISAPLSAAALGIDAINDWLQGSPSPRFRTRCRENADMHAVQDANIAPLADCPGCAST